jgi:hypothetical protein
MMKRFALALSLVVILWNSLSAQIISGSYDAGYVLRSNDNPVVEIPNPTSTYLSVRLRSFSAGFAGLIPDYHTDLFRNPAIGIPEGSTPDVFGDLGSVYENARFNLGSTIRIPSGTLSVSALLDNVDRSDRSGNSLSSSGLTYSWDGYTNDSKSLGEKIGGRVAASFPLEGGTNLGASYEFLRQTSKYSYQYQRTYGSPSSTSEYVDANTTGSQSLAHTVRLGYMLAFDNNRVLLSAAGVFSTGHSSDEEWNMDRYTSSYSSMRRSAPLDFSTRALAVEAILETRPDEQSVVRYAIDFALTSFSAPQLISIVDADTGYGALSFRTANGSSTFNGTVTDVRAGIGYQRKLGERLAGFAAASVGYIRNSGEGTTLARTVEFTTPPTGGGISQLSGATNGKYTSWDVRLPIGAEMFVGDYFTLRGGVEPRYRSAKGSIASALPILTQNSTAQSLRYDNLLHGLAFSSQFGISAHHEDYGEVSVLFGRQIDDTSYWTFFVRYYL